jgi:hypothetical protein
VWFRGVEGPRRGGAPRARRQLVVAAIVDAHRFHDTKMWQWYALGRAGAAEDVPAITAVVLAVREGEGGSASHADVRVGPFRWLL